MQESRPADAGRKAEESKAGDKIFPNNDSINENSRIALLEKLGSFGFAVDQYAECTIEQLQDLVKGAKWLHRTYDPSVESAEGAEDDDSPMSRPVDNKREPNLYFTEVDKKVLKSLLDSSGRVSSLALSRRLEIPLTTVQRRRKRLESEFLEVSYSLKLDKLGWRRAELFISTHNGMTSAVGKELLNHSSITRVAKSIGEHTIDLRADSVFKSNKDLLSVIEWIKSLEGVRDVAWTEAVEMIGKNSAIQYEIIGKHL